MCNLLSIIPHTGCKAGCVSFRPSIPTRKCALFAARQPSSALRSAEALKCDNEHTAEVLFTQKPINTTPVRKVGEERKNKRNEEEETENKRQRNRRLKRSRVLRDVPGGKTVDRRPSHAV